MTGWKSAIALTLAAGFVAAVPALARPRLHAGNAAMSNALLSPAMVFATWDADNDKKLTPEEFNAGWARMERAAAVRQLKAQFDRHDRDKSGAIDAPEYAALELVRKAGASAPPIARFDADKTGSLDFKEYLALVTAMAPKNPVPAAKGAPAAAKSAPAPSK